MRDFITGLQFLTTIRLWPETEWTPERFGRSVRYFPVIGAVVGFLLALLQLLITPWLPLHAAAALLVIAGIGLTGGLHCDGFMDSADGLLSGRSRERMLEIMKDSRVGANGVVAFVCLVVLKWSVLLDFPQAVLAPALFASPIAGRMAMVAAITKFPYARPEGIGKAFAEFSGNKSLLFAVLSGFGLIAIAGLPAAAASVIAITAGLLFTAFAAKRLGGLTGDIYGAVTEITEFSFLFAALILTRYI